MLPRWRAARLLLAAAALVAPPSSVGGDPERPAPGPYPSVAETRQEFQAICESLRRGSNPFYGEAPVAELEAGLTRPGLPPEEAATARSRLGWELFRLGRTAEAIAALDRARAEAASGSPLRLRTLRLLAVAHLRSGEEANCVAHHTPASCIFPLAGEGLHGSPAGARRAGDLLLELLRQAPGDPTARWLLNVARMASGDFPAGVPAPYRLPGSALAAAPFPRWTDRAADLGVDVWDLAGGAIMDDFDGDGRLDLLTSTMDPCGGLEAFRNDGRGGFENVTAAWGLDGQLGGLNLVHADYDGDGRLDLLVLRGGWLGEDGRMRRSLLRNDLGGPAGRFVDVTAAAGLAYPTYPSQAAAWADHDGDGDLDLYVGNEDPSRRGALDRAGAVPEVGAYPSQLFRNNGDGTFTDVARAAGVLNLRFAKGVAWGDVDDDGDPDLYVSNIGPNRLYRNQGDGSFVDVADEAGVEGPERSFATWFFDVDNDGDLDLWVNDYGSPIDQVFAGYLGEPVAAGHPVLYRNQGGGRFRDDSLAMGLDRPLLPMGANHGDLDNDGFPDVYLGTGVPDAEALMPNVMYRNDGGRRFQDVTFAGGFGHLQKGHGIAFGDLDSDGDQDLLEQMGGAFPYDRFANALYENPGAPGAWITLRLQGRRANRDGIGARLAVATRTAAGRRTIHALAGSGGSFGGSSLQQEIGLGEATAIESITIRWPGSGLVQTFAAVSPRAAYLAIEGEAELRPLRLPRLRLGAAAADR